MAALVFLFGLVFGSLANVIIYRLNTGESVISGGSRCFSCGRRLKWFELVPILSFAALRGRCRTCQSKISLQYPAVELASGLLFLLLYWQAQPNFKFLIFNFKPAPYLTEGYSSGFLILNSSFIILFWYFLFIASVYDIRHKILPARMLYAALGAALVFNVVFAPRELLLSFVAGFYLFAFFYLVWKISRGAWMGLGDAKMAFVLGFFVGHPMSILGFVFSFWLGSLVGLGLLAFYRKASLKMAIPFGPFLFGGFLAAFLWGGQIIDWYLRALNIAFF